MSQIAENKFLSNPFPSQCSLDLNPLPKSHDNLVLKRIENLIELDYVHCNIEYQFYFTVSGNEWLKNNHSGFFMNGPKKLTRAEMNDFVSSGKWYQQFIKNKNEDEVQA